MSRKEKGEIRSAADGAAVGARLGTNDGTSVVVGTSVLGGADGVLVGGADGVLVGVADGAADDGAPQLSTGKAAAREPRFSEKSDMSR